MIKRITLSFLVIAAFCGPKSSLAWGRDGHEIVGDLAAHFLPENIRQKVQKYLGKISFADAANWMDESKSNDYYGYMRTWHYIDFEKSEQYKPSAERNALTVLHAAIRELRNKQNLKKNKVREDLYLIFHLVGDLHQPLHVGYASDRGGNSVQVSYIYKTFNSNLHSVWDTDIIQSEKITKDSCLSLYSTLGIEEINKYRKVNELQWMLDSRTLLDSVYNFNQDKNFLDKNYVMSSKSIVTKQLLLSGLRLAAVLEELFKDKV